MRKSALVMVSLWGLCLLLILSCASQPPPKVLKPDEMSAEMEAMREQMKKKFANIKKEKREAGYKIIPSQLLPKDKQGYVDWAEAIRSGIVTPVGSIKEGEIESPPLRNTILFSPAKPRKGEPDRKIPKPFQKVYFPHDVHTMWLNCNPCHSSIFQTRDVEGKELPEVIKGKEYIKMTDVRGGQYCGRCHGRVAFPIRNCFRCHKWP